MDSLNHLVISHIFFFLCVCVKNNSQLHTLFDIHFWLGLETSLQHTISIHLSSLYHHVPKMLMDFKWDVCPTKTQISLHICAAWSIFFVHISNFASLANSNACILMLRALSKIFSRWHFEIFLLFFQDLTFYANCLFWRQFAGVKSCFLGKIRKILIMSSAEFAQSGNCLFVLRFYGPGNPMGSCGAWSVYLTTRLLGRPSPPSG